MEDLPSLCRFAMHPGRMFAVILATIFSLEAAIMLLMPKSLSDAAGPFAVAMGDSLLLTLLLAPLLWRQVVMPLQKLAACRQQLLKWAFAGEERRAQALSRDLHDEIGQFAAAINMGLMSLENSVSDQEVIRRARELRNVGKQLHDSIRTVARGLRPRALDDLGLAAAIENFAAEHSRQGAVPIEADVSSLAGERLPDSVETAAFRIVQESILNALRHAQASRISLSAEVSNGQLQLCVRDNGRGFDVQSVFNCQGDGPGPCGLLGMRERAQLLGGVLKLQSGSGKGTEIQVTIPIDINANAV